MTERNIELRPISTIVDEIREKAKKDAETAYRRALEYAEERIVMIERNRQAFALLDAAGIDLALPSWTSGAGTEIDLGFFPSTKAGNRELAAKIRLIRLTLDCQLKQEGKDLADPKRRHVTLTLVPVEFPGIRINYQRKLAKNAKCKIVRRKSVYSTLVCEV